jgi:hypothetical protein
MATFYFILIGICQTVLLIYYALYPANESEGFLKTLFPTKKHLSLVNLTCAVSIFSINRLGQFFCVPVDWASVVLILFTLSMILYSYVEEDNWKHYLLSFMHGIGFLVCIYCIIFYFKDSLVVAVLSFFASFVAFLPSFIISFIVLKLMKRANANKSLKAAIIPALFLFLTVLLPYFWLIQISLRWIVSTSWHKVTSITAIVMMLTISMFFVKAYKNVLDSRGEVLNQDTQIVSMLQANFFDNYMLERAIGWGLVYHLETCIYDGWRPPMHDPLLVFSEWVWRQGEPITHNFYEKKMLYEKFYPHVSYKKKCSCALEESESYFFSMQNL